MIPDLPITPYLDEICDTLKNSPSHFMILTAETGAGKSTAVPASLLNHFTGKILMLEPRRLAALAIANRVSEILGEETGNTCGYRVQLDSCISSKTRFEVITEAILTKKLQSDPSLEGVSIVVLDEFHERSIHADLALAFLKETMQLRDDLYVLVMSATIEAKQLSEYLGRSEYLGSAANENTSADAAAKAKKETAVFHVPGRTFSVSIEYAGMSPANAVLKELVSARGNGDMAAEGGDILVFFPGISEIRRCKAELETELADRGIDADIFVLHSSVSFSEQKKVLEKPAMCGNEKPEGRANEKPEGRGRRRVILSSAIAETSLTIPGVTTVIDTGYSRLNEFIVSSGMEKLVTKRESDFSAKQRAGRAGRTAPGKCIRLWNELDILPKQTLPEILRCDLSGLVLECFAWGVYSPEKLDWLNPPNKNAWETAVNLLEQLGCIKNKSRSDSTDSGNSQKHPELTDFGKAVLKMGISVRLACAAFYSPEVALEYSQFKDSAPNIQKKFLAELNRKISAANYTGTATGVKSKLPDDIAALLAGFPDRLAKKTAQVDGQNQSENVYQFPSGRLAKLDNSVVKPVDSTWLVAPEVDAGETIGRIYSFQFIPEKQIEAWLFDKNFSRVSVKTVTEFTESHSLKKTEYKMYGKIILAEKKLPVSDSEDFAQAVCSAVQKNGLSWLPLTDEIKNLLIRVKFASLHCDSIKAFLPAANSPAANTPPEKSVEDFLLQNVQEWLLPFLGGKTKVDSETVLQALRWYLHAEIIDKEVPVQIILANGKKAKVKYEENQTGIQPVIEIIIQQVFGCFETPKISGVPVLLRLLSPARRPLQITNDLAGFWQNSWPEICKEMKGRYPKHNWEYRISE